MVFDDARSSHAADDDTGFARQALRTVEVARKTSRLSPEMATGCRTGALVIADALTVTGLSHKAISRAVGVPSRTIDSWLDIDHPSAAPLGLLFALPAETRAAALSLGEIRTIAAAPSRAVVEQVAWMHERLAAVGAAHRDGRPHDALRAWHAMAGDLRGLGVLLAKGAIK